MLGQVGGVGKGLGAVRALVGLGLCVRLRVDLHLGLGEKGQRAYLTPVGKRQGHPGKISPTRAWIAEGRPSISETLYQCQSFERRVRGGGLRAGPQPGHPSPEAHGQQAGEQASTSWGRAAWWAVVLEEGLQHSVSSLPWL